MKKLLIGLCILPLIALAQYDNAARLQGKRIVRPLTVSDGCAIIWSTANLRFECVLPPGATGGEANTASTEGTGAHTFYHTKVSTDLRFFSFDVTAPLAVAGPTSNVLTFSMPAATGSQNGYLSSADWTTFNGKDAVTTATAPLVRAANAFSIPVATSTADGYLSSTDWSLFNGKESVLSFTAPLVRNSNTVSMAAATGSVPGYLANADWTTFNAKLTSPLTTQGDILFYGAASHSRLGAGTAGYLLQTGGAGANPSWRAASATPTAATVVISQAGSATIAAGWIPDLSATYAVAAKGVTNGDSHDHVGGDGAAIVEAALTLADNTTNDASSTKHGFVPKLPASSTVYLNGNGAWTTPAGGASVPGADTQVAFNDGGTALGADAGLTFAKATGLLTTTQLATSGAGAGKIGLRGSTGSYGHGFSGLTANAYSADWYGVLPDATPSSGQVLSFAAPAAGFSTGSWITPELQSNKNGVSGYAGLDSSSRIAKAQAPSATAYLDAANTWTVAQDWSGLSSLPIHAGLSTATPATCSASKELYIKTDATAGQQLYLCNTTGNGFVLLGDGTSGGATHTMLSSTHTDTSTGTVARGDLIVGQGASPTWARLAKGAQYVPLTMGANEPAWAALNLAQSAAITGTLAGANGGTGSAYVSFAGPTQARTFTLPDASSTLMATTTSVLAAQMPALTGDATTTAGAVATTVAKINGTSVPTVAAADRVLGTTASATGSWFTVLDCDDAAGVHLNYDTTTHAFSCGTTTGAAASAAFNVLGSGTNTAAAMVVGSGATLSVTGTGTINATAVNGTALSGLATGILKNTTTTGVPSIAVGGTDYMVPGASGTAVVAAQMPALTGDVTSTAGAVATTLATKHRTFTRSFNLFDPVAGDSGRILWEEPKAITITRVACNVKGGTSVVINLYKQSEAAPEGGTGGTKIVTSDLTCTTGALVTTSTFSSAAVASRTPVALTLGTVTGAVTDLRVFIEFTVD